MPSFCGDWSSDFFDSNDSYDFGACVQDVFLFSLPLAVIALVLLTKLRPRSSLRRADVRLTSTLRATEKWHLLLCLLVALSAVVEVIVYAAAEEAPPGSLYLSSALIVVTALLAALLLLKEVTKVVRSPSWTLFLTWTLFAVATSLRLRTEIRRDRFGETRAVFAVIRFALSLLLYIPLVIMKRRSDVVSLVPQESTLEERCLDMDDEVNFEVPCDLKQPVANEEEEASFFSLLTFSWMNELFRTGYREKKLHENQFAGLAKDDQTATLMCKFDHYYYGADMEADKAAAAEAKWKERRDELMRLDRAERRKQAQQRHQQTDSSAQKTEDEEAEEVSESVDDDVNAELQHADLRTPRRSLVGVIFAVFRRDIAKSVVFKALYDASVFVSPQLLKATIKFMASLEDPSWQGYVLALAMFLNAFVATFILHQYFHIMFRSGMRIRAMLIGTVYRKSLRLSPASRGKRSTGEIVNLMSTDAQRLQDVFPYVHMTWSAPLQIVLSIAFLWVEIGPSVLVGLAVMVFGMTPLSIAVIKRQGRVQRQLMSIKDRRVDLTNETLSAMRVLKMYAWELQFGRRIADVRDEELVQLRKYVFLKVVSSLFWTITPTVVSLTAFSAYTWLGNELTAAKAFTALALFNIIRFPLSILPMVLGQLVEAGVSMRRLATFLASPELPRQNALRHRVDTALDQDTAIEIANGTFFWDDRGHKTALSQINVRVPRGGLTMAIGSTGSGKSALLQAVIGELRTTESTKVSVHSHSVAYAAQTPWIQNATVKDNIIFGQPFDAARYARTVRVCALSDDLEALPAGDQTEIGEKGINLSGGQKQRVALARAVYMNADLVLLDDVLSAVDAHVGRHIFEECIQKTLLAQGKTVLLCTNSVHFLASADHVLCVENGRIPTQGTLQHCMQENPNMSFVAEAVESHSASAATSERGDTEEEHKEDEEPEEEQAQHEEEQEPQEDKTQHGKLTEKETVETGAVGWSVYRRYIDAAGGFSTFLVVLAFYTMRSAGDVATNRWLAYWSDQQEEDTDKSSGYFLGIYAALAFAAIAAVLLSLLICAVAQLRAARQLHDGLLQAQLRAPMSFFDTTPTGRILNRFTQDLFVADERLPEALKSYLWTVFSVVSTLAVIVYAVPWFALAILPMGIFYYLTSAYYLPTQRDLRRWMSVSVSPVYSHFGETLDGASTVRALSAENTFAGEAARRLNKNMRAYYPGISANRWLAVRLEFCGTVIVTVTACLLVATRDDVSSGVAGLALSYAMTVTQTLNWMVRMTADRETNIVSVERIQEYSSSPVVPSEAATVVDENRPPAEWPANGAVSLSDVTMRYRPNLPLVLRGLQAEIKPREKIGIVGRTGAGKSSVFQALLRLVEPENTSKVEIDGVNVTKIGLHDLRGRVGIIPQDPVLFSGTVKYNLDPFNRHSEEQIWNALKQAHLSRHVRSLDSGLQTEVREGGANFSVGQRQLLCLARALLRDSRVLLLDEATSAVDVRTDALVQRTIRSAFADRTVLTIAHRLETVLDADRVAVMNAGVIVEFDSPDNLLSDPKSQFSDMAQRAFGDDVQRVAERARQLYHSVDGVELDEAVEELEEILPAEHDAEAENELAKPTEVELQDI